MVYRGKLSKACAECRAKKTRCDAAKPSCGQCKRAKRNCSGYRDLTGLRVVDQSSEISSKLSSSQPFVAVEFGTVMSPSASSTSESAVEIIPTRTPSLSSPSSDESNWALSPIPDFSTPLLWAEGLAENVFFEQFLSVPGHFPKHDLGFVTPIRDHVRTIGMLNNVTAALGLAVILKTHKDQSLQLLATQKYASALKQTQKALQNPKLAKSDELMATVLLLGLHELVISDDPETDFQRHSVHLQGAVKLLQLRGQSQMDYNWGSRMLHRICDQVSNSCLYSRTPISPSLLRFLRSLKHKMHQEEIAGIELLGLCARLCDILHLDMSIRDSRLEIETTLQKLIGIDEGLTAWPATLSWRFDVEQTPIENPDKSFLTQQDTYLNHLTGTSWNRFRCIRIRCAEEIIHLAEMLPSSSSYRQTIHLAASTISTMTREICQSVPFFLGEDGTCWTWQDKIADPPTMYAATSMLMPLYFASGHPQHISPSMQEWILSQIQRIADLGIAKAKQILDERRALMPEPTVIRAWYED